MAGCFGYPGTRDCPMSTVRGTAYCSDCLHRKLTDDLARMTAERDECLAETERLRKRIEALMTGKSVSIGALARALDPEPT